MSELRHRLQSDATTGRRNRQTPRALIAAFALAALVLACDDDNPNPPEPDTISPVIEILAPEDGAIISQPRSIEIRARVTDAGGVRVAEFYLDDEKVGEDTVADERVYAYLWQATPLAAGAHEIRVEAEDPSGNRSEQAITFFLESTASP